MTSTTNKAPAFSWTVPKELGIPADPLRLRIDFHHQSTVMTYFQGDIVTTKQEEYLNPAIIYYLESQFHRQVLQFQPWSI